ncbi:carboxypeptidase-like regulatory domain-containing protein [Spirosoma soli]|uniref:Carboxypeptidase-like regulatory domain-containing protein n=1 Tax=Spirosoma soli TaxID=1770529 RepID=A0ABW5LXW7_9BACT
MKKLSAILTFFVALSYSLVLAQTPVATLTGRVIDAKTGQALPFATVYINNSSRGTNADENGVYRLTNNYPSGE